MDSVVTIFFSQCRQTFLRQSDHCLTVPYSSSEDVGIRTWGRQYRVRVWVFLRSSLPAPPLQFGETDSFTLLGSERTASAFQYRALNRPGNSAADQAIEPVVVGTLEADLPFVNRPSSALGLDAVFGRQVLWKP